MFLINESAWVFRSFHVTILTSEWWNIIQLVRSIFYHRIALLFNLNAKLFLSCQIFYVSDFAETSSGSEGEDEDGYRKCRMYTQAALLIMRDLLFQCYCFWWKSSISSSWNQEMTYIFVDRGWATPTGIFHAALQIFWIYER